jgi:DNA-binding XRE family transcriptional regulator
MYKDYRNIYKSARQTAGLTQERWAEVLGISRANAYTLMHSKDFPTITIGKRMIVPKDKLLAWMDERMSA